MNYEGRGGVPGTGEGQRPRRGRGQPRPQRSGARASNQSERRDFLNNYNAMAGGSSPAMREYGARPDMPTHTPDTGGSELLNVADQHIEAQDITNTTKVLMKISKGEHVRGARNDPKLREVLIRLYRLLHVRELIICPKELCDIAFALGKLQLNDQVVVDLLKRIADIAKYKAEQFLPHDMANIVWGFASLGVRDETLMSVVAAEVVNKIDGFDQRQLSNTAWAFAKCGLWNDQLVTAIAAECLKKIATFTAQSLSHISWAMAQWGTRKDELMEAIAAEVQKKTHEFVPAPLAMTAWSFANLQLKNTSLMTAISTETAQKITHFKTPDLAHIAWAFANLRIQDRVLFNIMADEIQRNINGTLPGDLANIAWAFSKNSFSHELLMGAIANQAISQIKNEGFKSAEVAMLTWAFAVAGLQNKQLMTEIGEQVAHRIEKYSAPQLSHIAWAFGALSLKHNDFLRSLSDHVHKNISTFKAQGLSNIAWAFAMVTFRDETLLRKVAPEIAQGVGELRPLALARCAWAYRVLAVQDSKLMTAISAEAVKKIDDFPTKALVKLIDSVYVSPVASEYDHLEKALASRTADVAAFLKSMWKSGESLTNTNVEEYTAQLSNFGLIEFGFVGTPLILGQIEIELPSRKFIQNCRDRKWLKGAEESQNKANHDTSVLKDFAAAEVEITAMGRTLHDWVVRGPNSRTPETNPTDTIGQEIAEAMLVAVDMPGCNGHTEVTYLVLTELCSRVFGLGIEPRSVESCASVEGSVQMLSTTLPCASSIGALRQFNVLFPNIILEFSEQAGTATPG